MKSNRDVQLQNLHKMLKLIFIDVIALLVAASMMIAAFQDAGSN